MTKRQISPNTKPSNPRRRIVISDDASGQSRNSPFTVTLHGKDEGAPSMTLTVTVCEEDIAAVYAELGLQRGCLKGRSDDDPLFQQMRDKAMEHATKRALDLLNRPPQGRA